ncbi:MAG: hypothetical protein WCP74_04045 [Sphingobacteriia bacterium]|jgi:hypothetical protein
MYKNIYFSLWILFFVMLIIGSKLDMKYYTVYTILLVINLALIGFVKFKYLKQK